MKFTKLHNNYTNPISGNTAENVFITDGFLKDDPDNKRLEVSFKLQKTVTEMEINFSGETPAEIEVQKIKTIAETVLVFDEFSRPTMITLIDANGTIQVDLFKHLADGGTLTGDEEIIVGYPSYISVRDYFLKDNLGDKLTVKPGITPLASKLVKQFLLEGNDKNGRPIGFFGENIGVQFSMV